MPCEYLTDPLEIIFAHEVMRAVPRHGASVAADASVTAHPDEPLRILAFRMAETGVTELPVIGRRAGRIIGVVALADLLTARTRILDAERRREHVLGSGLRLPTRKSGMV
jgi:CBS domain-containing protein